MGQSVVVVESEAGSHMDPEISVLQSAVQRDQQEQVLVSVVGWHMGPAEVAAVVGFLPQHTQLVGWVVLQEL